jgi:hypothetical protein
MTSEYFWGTDGHRATGCPCQSSLLKSFSQAEMIYLCINTRPSNPRMSNAVQVQILIGKYLLLNGQPFFIGLTRASH